MGGSGSYNVYVMRPKLFKNVGPFTTRAEAEEGEKRLGAAAPPRLRRLEQLNARQPAAGFVRRQARSKSSRPADAGVDRSNTRKPSSALSAVSTTISAAS